MNGSEYANYGVCHKCGAGIKYIFNFNGHTYGSTCIERMLGIKVEGFGTNDVNAIVRKIEEDKRTYEQIIQDEKDLYLPVTKRVFGSKHLGVIDEKIEVDVLVTEKFWFDGMYGSSCCIKMVDADYNQMVAFTTAKWIYDIESGDKISVVGTVKKHNKCSIDKVSTINIDKYEVNKVSKRTGNPYTELDYTKAKQDGHYIGCGIPDHVAEDLGETKRRGVYEVKQTQITRIKLNK
tara:strand:- start:63 stop:767 length:705 start_codon:yes stop_codon:yes gene_type:complete